MGIEMVPLLMWWRPALSRSAPILDDSWTKSRETRRTIGYLAWVERQADVESEQCMKSCYCTWEVVDKSDDHYWLAVRLMPPAPVCSSDQLGWW